MPKFTRETAVQAAKRSHEARAANAATLAPFVQVLREELAAQAFMSDDNEQRALARCLIEQGKKSAAALELILKIIGESPKVVKPSE